MSHREIEREPKIVERRSGGWLGKILSLVIGIVLGIVLTVGGVFGAGYLILNKWSVNETVGKVNGVAGTDINVNEFLNKEYGDKTVLALLSDVTAVASELSSGEGTFATLDKISPKVGAAMGTLAENFVKYGSDFTAEEIKFNLLNTPIKDFGGYLSGDLINSIILGEMLLSTGSFSYETLTDDPLMMVLFYGVEGEDYVLDSENKKIVMLGESKPLSIGNLRTDGITDTFSDIPLASLGFDDGGDAMMQALLYGPSNRYDVVEGDVQMKQVTYTFKGAGSSFACFDIDGEEVEAVVSPTAYGYMLSFESGKTQYVKLGTDGNYYAYKDEALQTPVRYQSTTIGDLQNNADGLLNGIELAGALGVNETSNPILISLAYGVEGEDFYYDTSGKIQMFEGKSPMTIGDLKGDSLNNVISDLAIDALVEVKTDDAMLCALAYGSTNRYTVTAGKVKMNQIAYTFDEAKFYDDKNAELELVGAPEVLSGGVVKISFVNKDEETETQYLKSTDGVNFLAYADEAATVPALYKKNTVGDLQDNPDELLNTIELASALNINEESSPILITLAYGLEGEDFYYDTEDKIQMYEGKYPKTIGDLKNGSMDDTVNNIPLDTLIKFDVEEDKMLAALAYGPSDHYTVDDDGNVTMNQVLYTQNEGKFYDIGGNEVTATATATGVGYTLTFESGSEYIEQDTDGNYYAYEDETKAKEILYQKNTIGDLQTNPNAILISSPS